MFCREAGVEARRVLGEKRQWPRPEMAMLAEVREGE